LRAAGVSGIAPCPAPMKLPGDPCRPNQRSIAFRPAVISNRVVGGKIAGEGRGRGEEKFSSYCGTAFSYFFPTQHVLNTIFSWQLQRTSRFHDCRGHRVPRRHFQTGPNDHARQNSLLFTKENNLASVTIELSYFLPTQNGFCNNFDKTVTKFCVLSICKVFVRSDSSKIIVP
jgi:hypothetical protein